MRAAKPHRRMDFAFTADAVWMLRKIIFEAQSALFLDYHTPVSAFEQCPGSTGRAIGAIFPA